MFSAATRWKAQASLILGLFSVCCSMVALTTDLYPVVGGTLLFASGAIVLGCLKVPDAQQPEDGRGRWRFAIGGNLTAGLGILLGQLLPPPEGIAESMRRAGSAKNLERIGHALIIYSDQHGGYLPMPVVYSADGRPLLSWRVAILPELGEEALYNEFRLDEPWDSPHNSALLGKMPEVYAAPGVVGGEPHTTFYQLVVGRRTIFENKQVRIPASFVNGSSNYIVAVEAGQAVPWTKPADLTYDPTAPLSSLGGIFTVGTAVSGYRRVAGFHVLMGDGTAHFIPKKKIPEQEEVIRKAIDKSLIPPPVRD
jgi:hypothetical protein